MVFSHMTSWLGTISLRLMPSVSVWNSGCRSCSSAWAATRTILDQELKVIKNAGTWKEERIITSRQGALIDVEGKTEKVLNFCANNYLGLSSHPAVVEAGKKALDKYGAGLSSVRFICGTQDLHKELERKVAKFHDREDAILYASCFDANAGLFEVLLAPEDAVISDELNHASIIDGIRLCKAQKLRYQHRNMKETYVIWQKNTKQWSLLTNVMLQDSLAELEGGYTTGKKELIDLLRQRSRPYLFSNTLPPPVVACASKVFDILLDNFSLTEKVTKNTQKFRSEMKAAGFNIIGDDHPICPVMLGDAHLASIFANEMLERGIYVIGFSFPVVPKGKARIRVQISAAHSEQDIDKTVDAFISVGKKLKVI
ncbi:glycine C-acetyltransferase isoform X1 [Tachypleus tridentatus]|uniref:glycine C-acetyltransferase isoform X1 n=1 Tax=Tachypleus tridentatus TaxID=6853 RepID=UPI003FD3574F